MNNPLAERIEMEAAGAERSSLRRAKVAHVTHYAAGLGAAVSAALAGYLANVDDATGWATLAGGLGAALAAVLTFMNPRERAAFQYRQSADFGALKRDAQRELHRSSTADDEATDKLSKQLTQLRRRVAADLQGGPSES